MIALLSPAKTLDLESPLPHSTATQPQFLDEAERLVTSLRQKSRRKLQQMMSISSDLADLNHRRYQEWSTPFTQANARPAIHTFAGDVYLGLEAGTLDEDDLAFAQDSVRILSGLYGVLRPLDLMQPYRLEMGCAYKPPRVKDLPAFWSKRLTTNLKHELEAGNHRALINLASNEYAQAVDFKKVGVPVLKIDFKEEKGGELRVLSFFAKKARGMMARYMIQKRVADPDDLKSFDTAGYSFQEQLSSPAHLVFARPQP